MDISIVNLSVDRSSEKSLTVNVEFKVKKDTPAEVMVKSYANEYMVIRVMDSEEEYDKYLEGLSLNKVFVDDPDFDPESDYIEYEIRSSYDKEPVKMVAQNEESFLDYSEETDTYIYSEWVENNPATQALVKMLEQFMSDSDQIQSYTDLDWHFMRVLRSISTFWY